MNANRERSLWQACLDALVLALLAPPLLVFAAIRAPRSIRRL